MFSLYLFSDSISETIDYDSVVKMIKNPKRGLAKDLSERRQHFINLLKTSPNSTAVLDSIEKYLQLSIPVFDCLDNKSENLPNIKWRSILSRGIRMSAINNIVEKPMVAIRSFYFEIIYCLIVYGCTLYNSASLKLGNLIENMSEVILNEAASLLCKASGVFLFASSNYASLWTDPPKNCPPEIRFDVLNLLSKMCLADADRIAFVKSQKMNMSLNTQLKLGNVCISSYEKCFFILNSLPVDILKELSSPFKSYLSDGLSLLTSIVMIKFACHMHENDKNGIAVTCISHSYNQLLKSSKSICDGIKSQSLDLLPIASLKKEQFVKINNNVTYQALVTVSDAALQIPSGSSIFNYVQFSLPTPIQVCDDKVYEDVSSLKDSE